MARAKKETKGSFVVRMRCVVTKEVVVEDCTEFEARENPWDHAVSETEVEQIDWEIHSVRSND